MVHLTQDGTPICAHRSTERCQYPTRREAFDILMRLEKQYPKIIFAVKRGPCPMGKETSA